MNNIYNIICCLTGFHEWTILVVPRNSWGDERQEGKICKQCNKIKDLVEKQKKIPNN